MLRRLSALILALALFWVPAARAADGLTLEKEREIGREAMLEVKSSLRLIDDPPTMEYIRKLGARLASQVPDSPFPYRFYVADEPDLNAFALPGGWIFIFRGMITSMESEGELAGVMAHEMSHVYYRHIAQRMKQSGPVNMASLAGLLAGLLLGGLTGSPQLGQAVAMGSLAGGAQKQLAFSREAEEQADYGGYKIITGLGYPPQEMENSFTRLARQARFTGPGAIPVYLRTHPTSPARMEKIQNLVRRYHPRTKRYDNMPFLRIRTRLIALYEPEDTARDSFHRRLRAHPGDPLALYGLALLAMRRSQYDGALALLKQLAEKWPGDIAVSRARGVCRLRQGEFAKAQATLLGVLRKSPRDQGALLALGQCYLKQDRLSRARDALSRVLKTAPDNEQAQYDLGITLGRQGHGVEASLHLGLAFKARGNIRAALYHLKRAEKGLSAKPKLKAKAAEALKGLHKLEKLRRKRSAEDGFGLGAGAGPPGRRARD